LSISDRVYLYSVNLFVFSCSNQESAFTECHLGASSTRTVLQVWWCCVLLPPCLCCE